MYSDVIIGDIHFNVFCYCLNAKSSISNFVSKQEKVSLTNYEIQWLYTAIFLENAPIIFQLIPSYSRYNYPHHKKFLLEGNFGYLIKFYSGNNDLFLSSNGKFVTHKILYIKVIGTLNP